MLSKMLSILIFVFISSASATEVSPKKLNFKHGKKVASKVWEKEGKTFYCQCPYFGKKVGDTSSCGFKFDKYKKRQSKIEWEHLVPAENFGRAFKEWRDGDPKKCGKKKGRSCAKKNPQYSAMEGDPYNLVPAIGAVNAYRSNYSFEPLTGPYTFGKCPMIVKARKADPPSYVKGDIARIYRHMNSTYPNLGIIGNKREKIFSLWEKEDPISKEECERFQAIENESKIPSVFLKSLCTKK